MNGHESKSGMRASFGAESEMSRSRVGRRAIRAMVEISTAHHSPRQFQGVEYMALKFPVTSAGVRETIRVPGLMMEIQEGALSPTRIARTREPLRALLSAGTTA